MGLARTYSAQKTLLSAITVTVEADTSSGTLHAFSLVGLPDKAVEESRDRVAAAIKNSGYTSPKQRNQKITIALAPANLKKEGPVFDVSIAVAYLVAAEDVVADTEHRLFLGELALDGTLRAVRGILPIVHSARDAGFREVFVPEENAREAALIEGITIYPARTLGDVLAHIDTKRDVNHQLTPQSVTPRPEGACAHAMRFEDVRGQEAAKRGLEIAAAGGHNIAMYGPPGTGKTMLARAFTGLLPELTFSAALEATAIHSVAGTLDDDLVTHPPFRAPHHTASYTALVGGGAIPQPGEATLAHHGVLFLDEFPEFDRRVIEALRQPLEERRISISRAGGSATFPADIILIAAMNPCPCGNYGTDKECTCTPYQVMRYRRKVSGPIIDRIDMWIPVARVAHETLSSHASDAERTEHVAGRVAQARERQRTRHSDTSGDVAPLNSRMHARDVAQRVAAEDGATRTLNHAAKELDLSPRSYHRVLKLARTIADLDGDDTVGENHVLEALQYRPRVWSA